MLIYYFSRIIRLIPGPLKLILTAQDIQYKDSGDCKEDRRQVSAAFFRNYIIFSIG